MVTRNQKSRPISPISRPKVVLTEPTLFGNDAAEDEREEIFNSYAFERGEVDQFADDSRPICIVRAYKGEGKSALLRLAHRRIHKAGQIEITRTASELAPELSSDDYHSWVRAWKASILQAFAVEIGSQIGVAWSDDAMGLVEEAEKAGFRKRSLVSSILDRLKLPEINLGPAEVSIPERKLLGVTNPQESVKRWNKGKVRLWLFVDDVDKNFEATTSQKLRVASFFDSCRELALSVPELRVRAVIRPNVWAIVKLQFESLSHVEQYVSDLEWSEEDILGLLSRRIQGYLKRTQQWKDFSATLVGDKDEREKAIVSLVFESPMPWGQGTRPPHLVLYTLSKRRPRWLIELAKVAATAAVKRGRARITHDDIVGELSSFGNRRIFDTVAEFKSQSPEIEELVAAFNREKEQLSTAELMKLIDNKILSHLQPHIAGISGTATNLQVAAFLFEIGLFYGRRDYPDGTYEHINFSDRPSLLRARTGLDQGLTWEIHPVFRQALEMRDIEGREKRGTRKRR